VCPSWLPFNASGWSKHACSSRIVFVQNLQFASIMSQNLSCLRQFWLRWYQLSLMTCMHADHLKTKVTAISAAQRILPCKHNVVTTTNWFTADVESLFDAVSDRCKQSNASWHGMRGYKFFFDWIKACLSREGRRQFTRWLSILYRMMYCHAWHWAFLYLPFSSTTRWHT